MDQVMRGVFAVWFGTAVFGFGRLAGRLSEREANGRCWEAAQAEIMTGCEAVPDDLREKLSDYLDAAPPGLWDDIKEHIDRCSKGWHST